MGGGVAVTKSSPVTVVPSESEPATPHDGDTVSLSSFDKCVVPFPVTTLLVFDRPIHEPAETVRKALSRALAHYRPIAGRLASGRDGEVDCLACTDDGVTFVAASAGCALDMEELATSAALLKDLAVYYPGDLCCDGEPLLLLQVTEFSCGGFVVGATWNHVVADGAGMGQFLQAVGELARGVSPPSVAPVRRWDDSLPGLPPSMVAAQRSTMEHEPQDLAYLDVTVPVSLIGRVRAESGGCTVYEAVTAVLWRCRTRAAAMSSSSSQGEGCGNPEALAPLAFPCNMRAHAGAGDGYYGNCVTVQTVPATRSAVASGGVGDLVRLIRRAKERAPDILYSSSSSSSSSSVIGDGGQGITGGDGAAEEPPQPQPQPQLARYDAVVVVSWRNLGFDAVDLGGGAPARVMWYGEQNVAGCVVCPPGNGREDGGVRVSAIFVKPEHVDAFLGELASLAATT